ncbi:peptidoglycan-binding protein [Streptacidiphilus sp. EB129]|jgi:peptidoglycan hydrolase-like protein with peptidoglycan-binding domain|uniref:peptidoglycan-binding domain-containing protein n=1 Tax=Streptacidiphilus sp. EB129 TaxID=3156262 RepID=UPI003516D2C3
MIGKRLVVRLGVVSVTAVLAAGALGGVASANSNPSTPWVGPGQTNTYDGVWCVQRLLNDIGDPGWHHLDEDGSFGPDTAGAIRAYQQAVKDYGAVPSMQVDGIVGPQTGNLLVGATYGASGTNCANILPT